MTTGRINQVTSLQVGGREGEARVPQANNRGGSLWEAQELHDESPPARHGPLASTSLRPPRFQNDMRVLNGNACCGEQCLWGKPERTRRSVPLLFPASDFLEPLWGKRDPQDSATEASATRRRIYSQGASWLEAFSRASLRSEFLREVSFSPPRKLQAATLGGRSSGLQRALTSA